MTTLKIGCVSTTIRRHKIAGDWDNGTSLDKNQRNGQRGGAGIRPPNGLAFPERRFCGSRRTRWSQGAAVSVVGIRATYVIGGNVIEEQRYWAGDDTEANHVDDINNATVRMREEADDLLQVGQIVMIARTVWVVKSRSESVGEIASARSIRGERRPLNWNAWRSLLMAVLGHRLVLLATRSSPAASSLTTKARANTTYPTRTTTG